MATIRTLHDLFLHELRDLYDAEHQILKALPKMIKKAHNADLKKGLQDHLHETKGQVDRLEQAFASLGEKAKRQKCAGMQGLLKEGEHILALKGKIDPAVRDAGIISAAQRVEHYEIAAYGCARAFAERMGHGEAASLLQANLDEEANADKLLTRVAESEVNREAETGHEEMDEREEKGMIGKAKELVGIA
jgi:ferritin-like metal-binding protein YciE